MNDLHARITSLEARLAQVEARVAVLESPHQPSHQPTSASLADPRPEWKPVLHKDCGKPAFFLTRSYGAVEQGKLEDMRVGPALQPPRIGQLSRCRHCDALLDPFSSVDLDWDQAILPGNPPIRPPITSPAITTDDLTGRFQTINDAISRARAAGVIS